MFVFLYSHLPPFLSKSQALLHSLLTWMVLPAESKETPQQSYEVKEPRLESLGWKRPRFMSWKRPENLDDLHWFTRLFIKASDGWFLVYRFWRSKIWVCLQMWYTTPHGHCHGKEMQCIMGNIWKNDEQNKEQIMKNHEARWKTMEFKGSFLSDQVIFFYTKFASGLGGAGDFGAATWGFVEMNVLKETDGWMDGQTDGWMDGRAGRWMDGRTDGRMDGLMDGWTDGWIDGWMHGLFFLHKLCLDMFRCVFVQACLVVDEFIFVCLMQWLMVEWLIDVAWLQVEITPPSLVA